MHWQWLLLMKAAGAWWFPFGDPEVIQAEDASEMDTSQAVPLVLPENAYEDKDGCWRIPAEGRGNLVLQEAGVKALLSDCPGGLALISWNGHARCGKSFMAGESTTMDTSLGRNFSAHFALGHSMDSCSKGIFINSMPTPHPSMPGVCIFQMDVEGLNAFGAESNLRSDAELALFTYLTSSIWTFSSRGAFDAHSLELLQIVTQLAESIDVGERSVTGPWLQWILQGVHLQPILKGKVVSAQKYFDSMLHTADDPFKKRGPEKQRAQKRNEIRESLVRSFAALNVTPFPPFTADEELLRQLPHITRDHPGLNSDFVKALDLFKISMLHAVKPLQLQRDHKLITAHGPTLVEFMRKALDYINNEQPVPIFNLVDEVINKQIEKAKEETKRGWRACMEHHLEIQQGLQLSQRQLALTRMAEAGQVSLPYWGAFLRKDVSRLLEASRFPHEERNLSAWHQGCYRKALATALEPLNEESHNVQERLVSKVEKELGIGPHQNASDRAIAHIERENKELANLYNVKLFELLGEAHLSHLRVSFLNVTSEDFQDMLRVFERAYAALSAGPGSMELYFEQKKKFLTHSEAFVSIGKMMREMEEKHDAALKEVRQLIENYKSDLAKLQNEYDVINAERGRLQQEMDLQARQHNDTLSNLLIQHENMKKRSEQLNETQWQLREQMSTRQQEHEAQIQRIQDEYATRQDQQKALAQNLQHRIQQKEAQFQNLTQQVEAAAANNALLREEIRRLEEQECGTRLVTACTDVNYGGTCRGLRVSWWSHCSLVNEGIPDNSMQSARIPPGAI